MQTAIRKRNQDVYFFFRKKKKLKYKQDWGNGYLIIAFIWNVFYKVVL